jgi:uncharacterized protein (DUF433 family)
MPAAKLPFWRVSESALILDRQPTYNCDMSTPASDKTLSVIGEHIVVTPGTCGGKPRIAGHRITVQNIVIWHERSGMSPDEIVAQYPQLSLADVHAALAYYWDHVAEILAGIAADEALAEQLRANSPSLLHEKLKQTHGDDSLPSR